ncbi:TPA: hypothetical protein HA239_01660 [Candidatus Woesearchaeota archaeon]|nr:hypothetical protein QT06_C0001G0932 [archaeon GW2011_AR15]MBS3104587.1 hypothetical protein [Candidatus Woesearchaeota archaeon]HIH41098.1 hypothetical protein [Candidatus Woesearchaeota archaeon]
MLYVDNKGKFFSEEETAALSSWEIELRGIHAYEENLEKRLFNHMDDMII